MIVTTKLFDSIITLRFGKIKVAKKRTLLWKKTIKMWNVDADNIVI